MCGLYIEEAKKHFLDNFDSIVAGLSVACAAPIAGFAACPALIGVMAEKKRLDDELAAASSDSIDKFFNSTFMDITAGKNSRGPYRCEKVKVRSTGNAVVDRVRERLSYNDIQVLARVYMLKELKDFASSDA